jgi:hypothetical protein
VWGRKGQRERTYDNCVSRLIKKPNNNHIAAFIADRTKMSNERGRSHNNWSFIGYNDPELAHRPNTDNGQGERERRRAVAYLDSKEPNSIRL